MKKYWLLTALIMILLSSCRSSDRVMPYFTNIDDIQVPVPLGDYNVRFEPGDEIFINVSSASPEATAEYNLPAGNPARKLGILDSTQPRQLTYIVDSDGDILFPVLGKIHVTGMTVEELRDLLIKRIGERVNDPIVNVELLSFRINVAGEVNRPGAVWVAQPKFSILDAITQAGDLNQYGRRDNVLLIREENGVRKHIRFNLNDAETLESPYFYVKQHDYIYVEPNDVRKDNAEYSQFYSYRLSVVSTIVSGCASVISLIIALTR